MFNEGTECVCVLLMPFPGLQTLFNRTPSRLLWEVKYGKQKEDTKNGLGGERGRKERPIKQGVDTYTLVELPVSPPCHGGVVPAVHLCDMVALDILDLVHGEVSGKRHLEAMLRQTTTSL